MNRKGIDVSAHQGIIDWDIVKDQVDFAILRCGYGVDLVNQDDAYFERNAKECTRLGIPFGVYLYSYASNNEEASSEADHVLRLIQNYKLSYPVYYDVEDAQQESLSNEQLTDMVVTFCEKIENAGYYVGIYANLNWFENRLNSSRLDVYDKWLAQWSTTPTYNKDFGMWQYTASLDLNGIQTKVDGDIAYLDYPTIIKEKGLNHWNDREGLRYHVGDNLILNGTLYRDSYGGGPGKVLSNANVIVTLVNPREGATKPYNVNNGLGWVAEEELSLPSVQPEDGLKVGDSVRIIKTGASTSNGGKTAYGLMWKREILSIYEGALYPYRVGNETGTTGFYKASALKKL